VFFFFLSLKTFFISLIFHVDLLCIKLMQKKEN